MSLFEDLKVFSGNAHKSLATDICAHLGITLGKCEVFKFTNDQSFVRIQENIREKDVFLVQPISKPVNDNLMELLIMIDAARRASAGRITAVIPYYAYGRTDKKDQPRVAITARLIADFLTVSGADRILTMNLHAGQIQGFFNIPVDELDAIPLLSRTYIEKNIKDLVVVATDVGSAKRARDMGDMLNAPIAIIEKDRLGNQDQVEAISIIGEVAGKTALIVDDEVDTAGSVIAGAKILAESGAKQIYCCVVHPLLSGNASKNLQASNIKSLLATDTLPIDSSKIIDKIEIISVAPILGEAIHRIHSGLSVGAMFENFK
ncbi:MAG: ribose-phosphate pyrophosphokinase [SAR202 cluster bacterium]|nr:ribose-phosphate pyrophosphokinase [SAR202 cluster bacterium]|tara:strand:- start:2594 stop:3550 length:957 start_codon:yes stop_codon:yes gene_type:complete